MGFFKTLFTGKEITPEEKAAEQRRNDFDMFKYDGIQALRIGKTDFAIECLKRALAIHDEFETRYTYANALIHNEDFDEAIDQLKHLVCMQPDNAQTVVALAELCFQQERYDETLDTCRQAIERLPDMAAPHHIMAKVQQACGNLIDAVAHATIAISKEEDYEEARTTRARLLISMQQPQEAEADIEHILRLNPENDEVLLLKGICQEMQGKAEEAKTSYRKVIELNPFVPQAYMQLAGILRAEGNNTEAADIAAEGLKLAPEMMQDITGEFKN